MSPAWRTAGFPLTCSGDEGLLALLTPAVKKCRFCPLSGSLRKDCAAFACFSSSLLKDQGSSKRRRWFCLGVLPGLPRRNQAVSGMATGRARDRDMCMLCGAGNAAEGSSVGCCGSFLCSKDQKVGIHPGKLSWPPGILSGTMVLPPRM